MTIDDKINKLKQLGVKITISRKTYPEVPDIFEFWLHPDLNKDNLDKMLDEEIKKYEDKPWLVKLHQRTINPMFGLCDTCQSYNFIISHSEGPFDYKQESCDEYHFSKMHTRKQPIWYCKDYKSYLK